MSKMNNELLNNVTKRFLPLPKSSVEGLEHEANKSDFNFIKELGIGSFGTVYLVQHKKTKAKYALKAIDKTIPENFAEKEIFNREVEIMYKLNHPNIVKLYGHFEDEQYCYFLMQYIPNKTLNDLIPEEGNKTPIKVIISIMKDLLCAVYYLHNMKPKIIHRDIKPENILLDQNSKAYLTDFGWSNYMSKFERRITVCGTPLYLPPEMIEHIGQDESADIWCIGVLLFESISGVTPFEGNDVDTVISNISKLKINWPKNMDPDAKDLISKILKLKGKERLTIEEILNHKFFNKYFPNAVKDLIKPDNQKTRTFVISVDDPKSWEKETNPRVIPNNEQNDEEIKDNYEVNVEKNPFKKVDNDITNPFKRNNNNSDSQKNDNLNNEYHINNKINNLNTKINKISIPYNKNNIKIFIPNNMRNNKININKNYKSNHKTNDINQNKKINVRATYAPKANIDLSNTRNKNKNNNKISISSYNSKNISNKRPSDNSYNKNYRYHIHRNSFTDYNKNNISMNSSNYNRNDFPKTYKYPINNNNYTSNDNYKNNVNTNYKTLKRTKTNISSQYNSSTISKRTHNNAILSSNNNYSSYSLKRK